MWSTSEGVVHYLRIPAEHRAALAPGVAYALRALPRTATGQWTLAEGVELVGR